MMKTEELSCVGLPVLQKPLGLNFEMVTLKIFSSRLAINSQPEACFATQKIIKNVFGKTKKYAGHSMLFSTGSQTDLRLTLLVDPIEADKFAILYRQFSLFSSFACALPCQFQANLNIYFYNQNSLKQV